MNYNSISLAVKSKPFPITEIMRLYMKWPRNHRTPVDLHVNAVCRGTTLYGDWSPILYKSF